MNPKPKSQKDFSPKSPIQWIYREWVKKLGSNELDNNYGGSRWLESKDKQVLFKENHHRHNPRKSVLIYISLEFDYKSSSCCYSIFLLIFRSPFSVYYFPFILSSFFHLHPPRVDQVVDFHSYPISTLLKSLGVAVRLKITVQVSLSH